MDTDVYALAVGKLIIDFQALEFVLRRFLYQLERPESYAEEVAALPLASVGQVVSSTAISNPDSLGSLIEKFNHAVAHANRPELSIDPELAETKSAVAQGRIWSSSARPPLRLVEFTKPANGLVTCALDEVVDTTWLDRHTKDVREALARVESAGLEIQPNIWVPGTANRAA